MEIQISEHQLRLLQEYTAPKDVKDDIRNVKEEKEKLEQYIEKHGSVMIDITNGRKYLVLHLKALSDLIGTDYVVCAPVRENGTYGAFYVKPYNSFRQTTSSTVANKAEVPQTMKRKPNMYQQLGYNI